MLNPFYEIYFWSCIFRDHGEFFVSALPVKEMQAIQTAQYFKNAFMYIHQEAASAAKTQSPAALTGLLGRMVTNLGCFIEFKRLLLRGLLECTLEMNLPPTFINHTLNEALEAYRILASLQAGCAENPTEENLHLNKIWIPDAAGHAATIASDLDPIEAVYIKEAMRFKKAFDQMTLKINELDKMLERACLSDGALQQFNLDARSLMTEFICFIEKMRELKVCCRVMAVFSPLVPDHMMREEEYYLAKLCSFME